MAYIQAFTGTYAPPEQLQALLSLILDSYPFTALSIGTRPDCLPKNILEVLEKVRSRTDLWIELGIQTVHDKTLRRIHRGHDWSCSRAAIEALHTKGIPVAVHVILGLPGETTRHFRQTASLLAELPLAGIKIHNLHVVRGTALEAEFRKSPFPLLDEIQYAQILIDFLRRLPDSLPVMRLTTDTPKQELVGPRWHMDKGTFLAFLNRQMERNSLRQGDLRGVS
jgi:radical SAM protein (TIGR01212 family)